MADFKGWKMTNLGLSILNSLTNVTFTTARTATATVDLNNVASMQTLPNVQQQADLITKNSSDNQTNVRMMFTNEKITTGYNIQSIGLYANDEKGNEKLFAVGAMGSPEFMPPKSTGSSSFEASLLVSIAQGNVTIVVNQAGMALQSDVTALRNELNNGDQATLANAKAYTDNSVKNAPHALTADKLTNAQQINAGGDVSGSVSFDGLTAQTFNLKVNHATNADLATNATNAVNAINATNANHAKNSDSATTASQLANAQPIALTGDATGSAVFDGTKGVNISVAVNHATNAANAKNSANAQNAVNAQTAKNSANADHATNSDNATNANQLTTPRNINGVPFDGTSDININANPSTNVLNQGQDLLTVGDGVYFTANVVNAPSEIYMGKNAFGILTKNTIGNSNGQMIFVDNPTNKTFTNTIDNGHWKGWKQLADTDLVNQAQSTANTALANAQTLNDKIDNLVYENRNLIIGSKKLNYSYGTNGNNVATITMEKFDDATNMYHIVAKKGSGSTLGVYTYAIPTTTNTTYTYSFDVKGTGDIDSIGPEQASQGDVIGNISNDWSRVSTTRTTQKSGGAILLYFSAMNQDLDVYVKLPKLEIGAKPTVYSQSPEDIDSATVKAQSTANTALANANKAQSTADTALTNVNNALDVIQETTRLANNAQSTAETALDNATQAQGTANTALSNANNANSAINNAKTVNVLNTTGADLFKLPSFGQYVFLATSGNANNARELKNLPPVNLQNFYGGFALTYSPVSKGSQMIELRRNVVGKYVSDSDSVVYIASNGDGTWKWLV